MLLTEKIEVFLSFHFTILMRKMIKLNKFLHICIFLAILSCIPKPQVSYSPINTDSEEVLFSKAENFFNSKKNGEALAAYREYLRRFPQGKLIPAALMRIGTIHDALGQNESARKGYMHIITKYPDSNYRLEAMVRFLESLLNSGCYVEVINFSKTFQRADVPDSYISKILLVTGEAQTYLNLTNDAVVSYSTAWSKSPDADRERIEKKLRGAIAQLETRNIKSLIDNVKNDIIKGYLVYQLGLNYFEKQQYREATDVLNNFIKTLPSHKNIEAAKNLLNEISKKTAGEPHTIGCLLPLSGMFSVFGKQSLKGVELALDRFSKQSGHPPFTLLIKDTESNPSKAEIAVEELIKEKVSAIIGPMGTDETVSAAKKAQTGRVPIIVLSQKENITDTGDFVFRNFLTPEMQVKSLVRYAMQKKGLNRFAVLYPNESYGKTFSALFISEVQANGGKILKSESYDPASMDFTDSIKNFLKFYVHPSYEAKDAGKDLDAIFIPDAPGKAGLIVPQLSYHDLRDIYLLGTNLWHSQKMLDMAGEFLEDWSIITESFFLENDSEDVIKIFALEFEEKYGEKPGFIEAVSYDTALMLFQAVGISNARLPDSVKKGLNNIKYFKGVTGLTSFSGSRDALKKLYILTVKNDRFIEAGRE
jgi:ABC-type branched-subunit amino acid transport system substrate-binding protein